MNKKSHRTYQITPVPKPRQTQRDKWMQRPAVMRYREFSDEAKLRKIEIPEAESHVIFTLPMPKSWSNKKKTAMDGKPHQQKPDVDNLLKALLDSLFSDDSHIYDIRATKVWGTTGQIEVICQS